MTGATLKTIVANARAQAAFARKHGSYRNEQVARSSGALRVPAAGDLPWNHAALAHAAGHLPGREGRTVRKAGNLAESDGLDRRKPGDLLARAGGP